MDVRQMTARHNVGDRLVTAPPRPRDDPAVRLVAVMFADLRGSTALYQQLGDVVAYRLVQALFDYLHDLVQDNRGYVVKTTGDGVMAVFAAPTDAVCAALDANARVMDMERHGPDGPDERLALRIGLHAGPVLAVRQHGRLDFFGSTVNLAARMLRQSRGGDIVLSEEFWRTSGVAAEVGAVPGFDETATVKGFARPVRLHRLVPALGETGVA